MNRTIQNHKAIAGKKGNAKKAGAAFALAAAALLLAAPVSGLGTAGGTLTAEAAEASFGGGAAPAQQDGGTSQFDAYAEEVIRLVNAERQAAGIPALQKNAQLSAAAMKRAEEILTEYSHNRPDGSVCFTVMDEYGYKRFYCAENIARGQESPAAVMESWMNSTGHRENILSGNGKDIGVGLAKADDGRMYWVQLFGSQA